MVSYLSTPRNPWLLKSFLQSWHPRTDGGFLQRNSHPLDTSSWAKIWTWRSLLQGYYPVISWAPHFRLQPMSWRRCLCLSPPHPEHRKDLAGRPPPNCEPIVRRIERGVPAAASRASFNCASFPHPVFFCCNPRLLAASPLLSIGGIPPSRSRCTHFVSPLSVLQQLRLFVHVGDHKGVTW
jgi:hypothetical protein